MSCCWIQVRSGVMCRGRAFIQSGLIEYLSWVSPPTQTCITMSSVAWKYEQWCHRKEGDLRPFVGEAEQNNFEQFWRMKGRFPGGEIEKGFLGGFSLLSITANTYRALSEATCCARGFQCIGSVHPHNLVRQILFLVCSFNRWWNGKFKRSRLIFKFM